MHTPSIRMAGNKGPPCTPQHIRKPIIIQMAHIHIHPKLLQLRHSLPSKLRKPPTNLQHLSRLTASSGKSIGPAPGKSGSPDPQIIKSPKQIQIRPNRIKPLQRQKDRNPPLPQSRLQFLPIRHNTNHIPNRLQILPKRRNLPHSHMKPLLRQIPTGHKHRRNTNIHPSLQKIRKIPPLHHIPLPIQSPAIHLRRQIQMRIHHRILLMYGFRPFQQNLFHSQSLLHNQNIIKLLSTTRLRDRPGAEDFPISSVRLFGDFCLILANFVQEISRRSHQNP